MHKVNFSLIIFIFIIIPFIAISAFISEDQFGESLTCAIAWGDYNNDGFIDLAVGNKGDLSGKQSYLYTSDGAGGFTQQDMFGTEYTTSLCWADYDNDGDLDIAVGNLGDPNYLYVNDGGVLSSEQQFGSNATQSLAWGDYDNDGDLDLAVCNSNQSYLYINNGNGTFTEEANFATGFPVSIDWGDCDGDGDLDLACGADGDNYLYLNNGDGTFTEVQEFGSRKTKVVSWGDCDNDGDLDLAVGNGLGQQNYLYRNDGSGTFTEEAQFGENKTFSLKWVDYDNDGDLDVACGNQGDNYIYTNDGGGNFTELAEFDKGHTQTMAWADYDNDGDLDLATGNYTQQNNLYVNQEDDGNNFGLHLVGHYHDSGAGFTNRDGIGTEIIAYLQGHRGDNTNITGYSQVKAGGGFNGQDSLTVEFGSSSQGGMDFRIIWWGSQGTRITQDVYLDKGSSCIIHERDVFHLVSPGDGQEFDAFPITLDWEDAPSGDLINYTVQISSDIHFNNIDFTTDVDDSQITIDETSGLTRNTYYWQVLANYTGGSDNYGQYSVEAWSFFLNTNAPPEAFNLLVPENGAITSITPYMDWEDALDDEDVSYELWYADNSGFSPSQQVSDLKDSEYTFQDGELTVGTTYYWKVRATDGELETWSNQEDWSFTVNTPPSAFNLLSPEDGSTVSSTPTLDWEDSSDINGQDLTYTLQYSEFEDFNTYDEVTGLTESTYTFSENVLKENTTYYWKVKVLDGIDETWCNQAYWSFVINDPPGAFNLLSPEKGSIVHSTPVMDWEDAPDAQDVTYSLWYSEDPEFTNYTEIPDIQVSTYTFPDGVLEEGNIYYWKVKASDGMGETWCNQPYWDFTVNTPPTAFNLLEPEDGENVSTTPVLDWEDSEDGESISRMMSDTSNNLIEGLENLKMSSGIDRPLAQTITYDLWISKSPDFGLHQEFNNLSESQFAVPEGVLENGYTYYWKVRATDGIDETWCNQEYWSFDVISLNLDEIQVVDRTNQSPDYTDETKVEVHFITPSEDYIEWMMISEDPSFTEAEWFQYENPASYELSEGDGDKTVYAKLADDNYNETEARQDSIFMDTLAPTSEIEDLPDNTGEQTFDVEYTSADAEPTSGIEYVSLYYKHYDEVPTGGYSNTHKMSNNLFDNTYMPSGSLNGGPFEQDPTDGWTHYETKDETEGYFEFDSTTAEGDGLYFFISVAGDTAGNVEDYKPEEEAERVVIMTGEGDEVAVLPVITPNNDGYNDLVPFDVLCGGSNAVLKIYNRKHTLVYEEEGQSPVWDGCDSGGVPVPGGVYFYQLETTSDTYFGTITVIK